MSDPSKRARVEVIPTADGRTLQWRNLLGLYGLAWRHGFWCRLGKRGPGLSIKHRREHIPLFSERHGLVRVRYVGPLVVKRLRRFPDEETYVRHVREVERAWGMDTR